MEDKESKSTVSQKIKHLFTLMGKLANGEELYAQDEQLQDFLFNESGSEKNVRALRRYLDNIHELYSEYLFTEKKKKVFQDRKVTVYRTTGKKDVSNILKYFLHQKNDLTWIVQMIQEQDPDILHDLEFDAIASIENELAKDKDIFLFSSQPFEIFTTDEEKQVFTNLKKAVKNNEYRTIYMQGKESAPLVNVKCLKMIYSQNNWYIAIETEKGKLKLSRIKFISKVAYSTKNNYQKSVLLKYQDYFLNFENPMTLAGREKKKAILKVSPDISKYFEEDMKTYFKSQQHVKTHMDGSIEFSIKYTQDLEILPFVKRWIPEIEILSPASLREKLLDELKYAINVIETNL